MKYLVIGRPDMMFTLSMFDLVSCWLKVGERRYWRSKQAENATREPSRARKMELNAWKWLPNSWKVRHFETSARRVDSKSISLFPIIIFLYRSSRRLTVKLTFMKDDDDDVYGCNNMVLERSAKGWWRRGEKGVVNVSKIICSNTTKIVDELAPPAPLKF